MKNFSIKRILITLIPITIFALMILFSLKRIHFDTSIKSFLPPDTSFERSLFLSSHSSNAKKMILFIQSETPEQSESFRKKAITLVENSGQPLKNTLPSPQDLQEIRHYIDSNALLLYPHEEIGDPFSSDQIARRLGRLEEYVQSNPFALTDEKLFRDPLRFNADIYSILNQSGQSKLFPENGGIYSSDRKSFMMIFDTGILPDQYDQSTGFLKLDRSLQKEASNAGVTAFLFGAHLFYLDSFHTIQREVTWIFIVTLILTFAIFFYFFRNLSVLFYSLIPVAGGFAVTFFIISLFRNEFGGIAFAFGSSTTGIALDYTIHYLSKISLYPTLKELRSKIGLSMFMGVITTLIAFGILMLSGTGSLIDIALFGMLSIAASFLINWFFLQRLIRPENFTLRTSAIQFPNPGAAGFIIWTVLLLLVIIGTIFSHFENNLTALDKRHPALEKKQRMILDAFQESPENIFLVFEGKNKEDVDEKSLNALYSLLITPQAPLFLPPALLNPAEKKIIERKKIFSRYYDPSRFHQALSDSIFNAEAFAEWNKTVGDINNYQKPEIPSYLADYFHSSYVEKDGITYLMIYQNNPQTAYAIFTRLQANHPEVFIVDTMKDGTSGLVEFEKKSILMLFAAWIAVVLVLVIAFRNPIAAVLSSLPAIVALLSTMAISFYTGRGFNILHLASAVLLFGIGVDYGIFTVNAYLKKMGNDEINANTHSLLICALTTLAGFGVLSFSSNQSVFSLGTAMFAGITLSFLTSYLAVPFLIKIFLKKQIRDEADLP